jgi:hypothetical protein
MTLSSIGSNSGLAAAQLYRFTSTSPSHSDVSSTTTQQPSGISRFASAISAAFASLGISLDGSSSSTSASGSTDASSTDTSDSSGDTVNAFVQSLFAALHSQSAGSAPPPPSGDNGTEASPSQTQTAAAANGSTEGSGRVHRGHGGHGGHGGGGKIEADLQSLIQELSTASSTSTASTTAATTDASTTAASTTAAATSTDSTLATLEKSFDALVSQTGGSTATGTDSLTSFLKALAAGLQGAPSTGNVLTTQA